MKVNLFNRFHFFLPISKVFINIHEIENQTVLISHIKGIVRYLSIYLMPFSSS